MDEDERDPELEPEAEPSQAPRRGRGRPSKASKLPAITSPEPQEERLVVRKFLTMGHRDALGFLDGPGVPLLTSQQKEFIGWYLETGDELAALDQCGLSIAEAESWRASPGFMAMFQMCHDNPREGYKILTGQLLGATYRAISEGLQSDDWKERMESAKLLSRTQGLLVDKATIDTQDALTRLMDKLNEMQPIQVVDIKPRD